MTSSPFQRAPQAFHLVAWLALLSGLLLTGCGGGGGSAAPSTAFTLQSDVFLTGGSHSSGTIAAGTQTFTLIDKLSHSTTFSNVSVPVAITGTAVTVIRARSVLITGTYSTTTAILTDPSGNQGSIALTNGAFANDTAFATGSRIALPVSAIGALTFSGGITATVSGDAVSNNTGNNEFVLSTTAANLPAGSNTTTLSGTYQNISSPPIISAGSITLNFANQTLATLSLSSSTGSNTSSPTFTGSAVGSTLPYATASLTITASN